MSLPFFRQEINFDWFETQLSQIFFNHTWVLQDITLWITIRRIMKFSHISNLAGYLYLFQSIFQGFSLFLAYFRTNFP